MSGIPSSPFSPPRRDTRDPLTQNGTIAGLEQFGYKDESSDCTSSSALLILSTTRGQMMASQVGYQRQSSESRQDPTSPTSQCTSIEDDTQASAEFKERTKTNISGHRFGDVAVDGKVHFGDNISNDWKGKAPATVSHQYQGVKIGKDGKALMGNNYGTTDFWAE